MKEYLCALCLMPLLGCSVFEPPFRGQAGDSGMDAGRDAGPTTDAGGLDAGTDADVDAGVLPIPTRPTLASCGFGAPIASGTITNAGLDEISGIAVSRRNPRIVWMVEDSGAAAVVHAVNDLGELVATYMFSGTAIDCEDLAIGPGPVPGEDYLYIGDIGNNTGNRPTRAVYRAPEPVVAWNQTFVSSALTSVEPFPFTFPQGLEDNAEALFVDPETQDLYIVTKNGFTRPNTVYVLPAPHTAAVSRTLAFVATVYAGTGIDIAVTGADISADGSRIAIRSLHVANVFTRASGATIADTLGSTVPCEGPVGAAELKGESFSFGATGYFTTSEGVSQPLTFVPFAPN